MTINKKKSLVIKFIPKFGVLRHGFRLGYFFSYVWIIYGHLDRVLNGEIGVEYQMIFVAVFLMIFDPAENKKVNKYFDL